MSLYADYIKEREDYSCIEDSDHFVTYKKIGKVLYLRDLYIVPNQRRNGLARKIVNNIIMIAKELDCKKVVTTIDSTTNNWEINKKGILSAGFVDLENGTDTKYFIKEISNG